MVNINMTETLNRSWIFMKRSLNLWNEIFIEVDADTFQQQPDSADPFSEKNTLIFQHIQNTVIYLIQLGAVFSRYCIAYLPEYNSGLALSQFTFSSTWIFHGV